MRFELEKVCVMGARIWGLEFKRMHDHLLIVLDIPRREYELRIYPFRPWGFRRV